jgi:hypothetical protein
MIATLIKFYVLVSILPLNHTFLQPLQRYSINPLYETLYEKIQEKLKPKKVEPLPKTEDDLVLEILDDKPW